ncbi:fatty acid--CoA ligase [Spirochaeta isovalerica]|uniref:Fatty-acyl-CoA synthase n=1 Tax=Spirochaeta isovalerica TaxID=150 RepID=A0A841R650_9SPIO|nr:fatty acid--CoA ligase [Spirochaeta isovalerica]MBB6479335.1 fatty-acyl-CoA synthase [Spirochaeta isovalerica]
MNNIISKTESAYEYPLLIKQLFLAPVEDRPEEQIIYRDETAISYRLWRERVHKLANALESVGVTHGSTVAMLDWDSHRYLECYYAVPMMGAVLHMINMRLSPEQLAYTIEHAEDDVIICHADFLPLLEAIKGRIAEGRKFIIIDENGVVTDSALKIEGEYEVMLAEASSHYDFPDFDENTRATTFYTTGTTGLPKGVYFSHRQMVLHTLVNTVSLSSPSVQGRMHRESVYMPMTPMFHVHAWGIPYIATYLGIKQVYPGKYEPAMLLKLLVTHKVTFSHCVPTILHLILKSPAAAQFDLSNWSVIIGGAALPKAMTLMALERGIDVFGGYGMSETAPVLSISHLSSAETELPPEEQAALRSRTGKPVGLTQLRIVDEEGKDVPRDDKTPGEIIVRSPYLTQGYLKDNVHSEKLWEGGWLHTNDVACINEQGSVRIVDRTKDVIKVGGEWLGSLEIEDVIARHEGVSEVAVIAFPDDQWGEVPMAIVVTAEGAEVSESEVKQTVKASVDSGVLPREAITLKVRFADAISKTSVGKTNKVALREQFLS